MLACSRRQALLDLIGPFQLGSGRKPRESDICTLNILLEHLALENPTPVLSTAFQQVAGLWKCVFTTSRFVLDLDRIPGLRLSGVYQVVSIDPNLNSGHYFNIAELARGEKVKCVCGEFASIRPSQFDRVSMDVEYRLFYCALRMRSEYEGHRTLAAELQCDRLRGSVRFPFRRCGFQSIVYLDDELRVVRGNEGGVFVLLRQ
jgi:hypothetical protein